MIDTYQEFLDRRKERDLLRALRPFESRKAGRILCQGRALIDFCSNDYLGLSEHPRLAQAIADAANRFGSASGASRLMSGDLELHHELERGTARFKGKEAALVLNSGYQANVGLIAALVAPGDVIFADRLSHASLIDGMKLSGAAFFRFDHNTPAHLRTLLESHRAKFRNAWIITETVFSMDGDCAPLRDLVALKNEFECRLMVDEAHATGLFGPQGAGLVEAEGVPSQVDLIMGTFSKALAGFGAYAACSEILKEYLINACRSFIYSTALPPCVIAGNRASLQLVAEERCRRQKTLNAAAALRAQLTAAGFKVTGSTQIIPVILGENNLALHYAQSLESMGFRCLAVRHPTVPAHAARLRLSVSYHHSQADLDQLVQALTRIRDAHE